MSLITLLPDLPGCSVEQMSQTEEAILITACATAPSASCPDCLQVSSRVHSSYTRLPVSVIYLQIASVRNKLFSLSQSKTEKLVQFEPVMMTLNEYRQSVVYQQAKQRKPGR